ncbi:MAG: glycoside hydrolase family 127 protein [Chthonomonadales bacterium]|nr:glycoside hydrolase family 127 protein [Chthonomonadales bacterium]
MPRPVHHPRYSVQPVLEPAARAALRLGGPLGERLQANARNWLLTAPEANPGMLQMFRDRNRTPPRDLMPWAGEFAGKYLTAGVTALRAGRPAGLAAHLRGFVRDLVATQAADGYLGPFPAVERMTGPGRWDLWGQYHVMLGLLMWHEETGDRAAWHAATRCADRFCREFLSGGRRVRDAGSEEMNQSCAHAFALLYRASGEPRYLQMLREIEADWETPPSGDYVRTALAGLSFWQTPRPRWESLHAVQAVAELAFLTGEPRYREAFERIWWSIVEGDRHNTGGFSSGEQATGNPYNAGAIETCCTVAWMALTVDYLRMSGSSLAADELEIATWNAVLGAQNADGRWWTYNTPMDGERRASAHDIVFQARPGTPELNCCSVNGPRALAMVADWGFMAAGAALVVNHLGPGACTARLASGNRLTLAQQTDYPIGDRIRLLLSLSRPEDLALRVRVPGWSERTEASLNGRALPPPEPGAYLEIERRWEPGDKLDLRLDMRPWLWVGEREAAGKASIYRGPLLLAYDPRFGVLSPEELPELQAGTTGACAPERPGSTPRPTPLLLTSAPAGDGRLPLCDFASAGGAGNPYRSWLPMRGAEPAPFTRTNPLRRVRVTG